MPLKYYEPKDKKKYNRLRNNWKKEMQNKTTYNPRRKSKLSKKKYYILIIYNIIITCLALYIWIPIIKDWL